MFLKESGPAIRGERTDALQGASPKGSIFDIAIMVLLLQSDFAEF